MPPKNKFTKEDIINVAFNIAKEDGFDGISIRKVASKVGCSIAPIYVNFNDVEDLKSAVVKKIEKVIKELIDEQNTGEAFLDIGVASVKFARDYSVIYKEFILKGNIYISEKSHYFKDMLIKEMKKDSQLKDFNDEELKLILMKMKAFQIGLSIMATEGEFMEQATDDKIIEILKDVGMESILGVKYRKKILKL